MKLISPNLVSQSVELKEQVQVLADAHHALLTTVYEADQDFKTLGMVVILYESFKYSTVVSNVANPHNFAWFTIISTIKKIKITTA